MKRVRLLKVLVQPVFVVDDGTNVEELTIDAVQVKAAEWDTFAKQGWDDACERVRQAIDPPQQNRQQRRARARKAASS